MNKKIFCRVETDEKKISHTGLIRILSPLKELNKINYIFEAKIDENSDSIFIDIPEFLYKNKIPHSWCSSLSATKRRKKGEYTFVIIENCQLEFDF